MNQKKQQIKKSVNKAFWRGIGVGDILGVVWVKPIILNSLHYCWIVFRATSSFILLTRDLLFPMTIRGRNVLNVLLLALCFAPDLCSRHLLFNSSGFRVLFQTVHTCKKKLNQSHDECHMWPMVPESCAKCKPAAKHPIKVLNNIGLKVSRIFPELLHEPATNATI